jgi:hypothetical protein
MLIDFSSHTGDDYFLRSYGLSDGNISDTNDNINKNETVLM